MKKASSQAQSELSAHWLSPSEALSIQLPPLCSDKGLHKHQETHLRHFNCPVEALKFELCRKSTATRNVSKGFAITSQSIRKEQHR